jgi:hypothetical protein
MIKLHRFQNVRHISKGKAYFKNAAGENVNLHAKSKMAGKFLKIVSFHLVAT